MIAAPRQRLVEGLLGRRFNLYYSDNMSSLTTPTGNPSVVTTFVNYSVGNTDTLLFRGYFIPDQTSTNWYIRTRSDDSSLVWIGTNAAANDTDLDPNAPTVDNSGLHAPRTRRSGALSLTANAIYPFTVVVGNNTGPGILTLQWVITTTPDDSSVDWEEDGSGYLFHNPKASNGFNL